MLGFNPNSFLGIEDYLCQSTTTNSADSVEPSSVTHKYSVAPSLINDVHSYQSDTNIPTSNTTLEGKMVVSSAGHLGPSSVSKDEKYALHQKYDRNSTLSALSDISTSVTAYNHNAYSGSEQHAETDFGDCGTQYDIQDDACFEAGSEMSGSTRRQKCVDRSAFADVSKFALERRDKAKEIFLSCLAHADLSKGPLTAEIIRFHLVPRCRRQFNHFVRDHGCIPTNRPIQQEKTSSKSRKSMQPVWFSSVTFVPDAQQRFLERCRNENLPIPVMIDNIKELLCPKVEMSRPQKRSSITPLAFPFHQHHPHHQQHLGLLQQNPVLNYQNFFAYPPNLLAMPNSSIQASSSAPSILQQYQLHPQSFNSLDLGSIGGLSNEQLSLNRSLSYPLVNGNHLRADAKPPVFGSSNVDTITFELPANISNFLGNTNRTSSSTATSSPDSLAATLELSMPPSTTNTSTNSSTPVIHPDYLTIQQNQKKIMMKQQIDDSQTIEGFSIDAASSFLTLPVLDNVPLMTQPPQQLKSVPLANSNQQLGQNLSTLLFDQQQVGNFDDFAATGMAFGYYPAESSTSNRNSNPVHTGNNAPMSLINESLLLGDASKFEYLPILTICEYIRR